ncbi:MAG TPA: hypothetical protein VGR18_04275 [Rubrobacter sp.]|nr:hypothetical protein [Rubrobacter sp.]
MGERPERSALTNLIPVPGLVAVAILGIAVAAMVRFFGPVNVLREVSTELVASFGSTILVLAVFGLLFRTGLERLLRGAPGGETLARPVERLGDMLQSSGAQDLEAQRPGFEAKLDRIGRDVHTLADREIPASRKWWQNCAKCRRIYNKNAMIDRHPSSVAILVGLCPVRTLRPFVHPSWLVV